MDVSFRAGESMPNTRYLNAVDQIYHAAWTMPKLAQIRRFRQTIARIWPNGHPTRLVHVVGTSGKGSVSRMLEAGFSLYGRAGAFSKPHLLDYRERISILGQPADPNAIAEVWEQQVLPINLDRVDQTGQPLNFYENTLLLVLYLFERYEIEWAALESGVGGRYDMTSALDVVACVLTNVGRDHEAVLGSEAWQRALDKAGVARPKVPFLSSERAPEIREIIASVCNDVGAPLSWVEEQHEAKLRQTLGEIGVDSILHPSYQQRNAALVLETLAQLLPDFDYQRTAERLKELKLLGRMSEIEPGIFIDVAHNPDKIAAFANEVAQRFPERGKIFVVSVSGERDAASVLAPLLPLADALIVSQASYHGQPADSIATSLSQLRPDIPIEVIADPRAALEQAKAMRRGEQLIFVTGSTYMIEQAINPDEYMRHINATYGWRLKRLS